jgi:hypothetical protein
MNVRTRDFHRGGSRARRILLIVLPLVVPPLVLGGCRGEGAQGTRDLDVNLAIAPTPPTIGEARIVVTLSDRAASSMEEAGGEDVRVEIEGNMTHAGMTPVHARATREAPDRWVVAAFPFTMAGDWILTTRVSDGDELLSARDLRVRVVGAGAAPSHGPAGE